MNNFPPARPVMMITGLLLAALAVAARGGDDAEETLFLMMSMPRTGRSGCGMLNTTPRSGDGEPLLRLGRTTGTDGEQAAALRDVLVSASAGRSDAHGVLKPARSAARGAGLQMVRRPAARASTRRTALSASSRPGWASGASS